jgi:SAM-dependent methyltransferase
MAERGAHATGLDISGQALEVARAYYEAVRTRIPGAVEYHVADLNEVALPAAMYDVIAARGTLHHLVRPDHLIQEAHRALKPGGLLWVADTHGEEAFATVLVAGALAFVLPTETCYREKLRALARFRLDAPSRVQASMQAEGLSAFEGAGRGHDWLGLVGRCFAVERRREDPAFTGYISAQLRAPDRIALPLVRGLRAIDRLLVRSGALRSTGVVVWARKTAVHRPAPS